MKQITTLSALIVAAGAASAQTPDVTLHNLGTLTCTTHEAPPEATADAQLSCRFKSTSGEEGTFTGYIARIGQADLPPGKRVLAWTVLSSSKDIGLRALAGVYAGETGGEAARPLLGGEPEGRMLGGEGNAIILQPTTVTSQLDGAPVPTVLRLRLEPVEA
jgi:hypothetical protein